MKSSIIKTLTIIFNFVIFVCGAVILGLGVWSVVANVEIFTLLDESMLAGVYILIVSGAVVMLLSFLGCYGCMNDNKPAIVVYSTITVIAAVLKTIGCIILYVYYIRAEEFLANTYKLEYGVTANVTSAWDKTQASGQCCGLLDYRDWENSYYFNSTNQYPSSCCVRESGNTSAILNEEFCHIPRTGFIHESGCDYFLQVFYYAIGSTTIFVVLCELAAVIFIVAYYQWIP